MLQSTTLNVSIESEPKKVYEFASNPENLPKWAKGLCESVRKDGGEWIAKSPQGEVKVRFAPANEYGILDHVVTLPNNRQLLVPMRVVSNGKGSEVIFTFFRPDSMTEADYTRDIGFIKQDLQNLKKALES